MQGPLGFSRRPVTAAALDPVASKAGQVDLDALLLAIYDGEFSVVPSRQPSSGRPLTPATASCAPSRGVSPPAVDAEVMPSGPIIASSPLPPFAPYVGLPRFAGSHTAGPFDVLSQPLRRRAVSDAAPLDADQEVRQRPRSWLLYLIVIMYVLWARHALRGGAVECGGGVVVCVGMSCTAMLALASADAAWALRCFETQVPDVDANGNMSPSLDAYLREGEHVTTHRRSDVTPTRGRSRTSHPTSDHATVRLPSCPSAAAVSPASQSRRQPRFEHAGRSHASAGSRGGQQRVQQWRARLDWCGGAHRPMCDAHLCRACIV